MRLAIPKREVPSYHEARGRERMALWCPLLPKASLYIVGRDQVVDPA